MPRFHYHEIILVREPAPGPLFFGPDSFRGFDPYAYGHPGVCNSASASASGSECSGIGNKMSEEACRPRTHSHKIMPVREPAPDPPFFGPDSSLGFDPYAYGHPGRRSSAFFSATECSGTRKTLLEEVRGPPMASPKHHDSPVQAQILESRQDVGAPKDFHDLKKKSDVS